MTSIVLGNILTLIAIGFTYLNGTRKKKRDMIICDMGAATCFTLSHVVLRGYVGVVQNLVGVFRNITALFLPNDKFIGWILVACGVIFGIYFNNMGIIGLLPVASGFWYSFCVINKKASSRMLKMALIINSFAFAAYSLIEFNIVGIVSNILVACTTLNSYIKDKE